MFDSINSMCEETERPKTWKTLARKSGARLFCQTRPWLWWKFRWSCGWIKPKLNRRSSTFVSSSFLRLGVEKNCLRTGTLWNNWAIATSVPCPLAEGFLSVILPWWSYWQVVATKSSLVFEVIMTLEMEQTADRASARKPYVLGVFKSSWSLILEVKCGREQTSRSSLVIPLPLSQTSILSRPLFSCTKKINLEQM